MAGNREQCDPLLDERNLFRIQLVSLVGRHVFIGVRLNSLEQRTLVRPTGNDDRTIGATGHDGLCNAKVQASLLLLSSMAAKAILAQNRFDMIDPHRLCVRIVRWLGRGRFRRFGSERNRGGSQQSRDNLPHAKSRQASEKTEPPYRDLQEHQELSAGELKVFSTSPKQR